MQQLDKMIGNFGHHHYMNGVRHDHEFIFNDNHALEQYCGKMLARQKCNSRGSSLSSNSITNSNGSNRSNTDKTNTQVHINFFFLTFLG